MTFCPGKKARKYRVLCTFTLSGLVNWITLHTSTRTRAFLHEIAQMFPLAESLSVCILPACCLYLPSRRQRHLLARTLNWQAITPYPNRKIRLENN